MRLTHWVESMKIHKEMFVLFIDDTSRVCMSVEVPSNVVIV